jgi:hypothetical protein
VDELGLDVGLITNWFRDAGDPSYIVLEVDTEACASWPEGLAPAIRRCYISDEDLLAAAETSHLSHQEVIASKLPDPGSVMSGDFGEILAMIFQASSEFPKKLQSPKKWRLKQDRQKPAPHADVVQFYLPAWPNVSSDDKIICTEVKTKATPGSFRPIQQAVLGREKDRTSRLAKTLVWLRERGITSNLGTTTIQQIDRFIKAAPNPPAVREYFALAVICNELATSELEEAKKVLPTDSGVVVIIVPKLKEAYTKVFESAKSVPA